MKKLSYIVLCILITINLVACISKSASTENANTNIIEKQTNSETNKDTFLGNSSDATKETSVQENKRVLATQNKVNLDNKSSVIQNNKATNANSNKVTQQATQSKNKVIVIDPGHANRSNLDKEPLAPGSSEMKIKDGGGAQGIATRTPEYRVNMNVAVKLKALLQSKGYTVVMTKTQDSQSLGNVERANIWNNANAALVIRIHADSNNNTSIKGASMLVPSPINDNTKAIYAASKSCGRTILNTLVQEVGMANRGVTEHNDMTGFNWTKVPVILVEMGFLSNPDEDRLLSSQTYEDKLAKALADGIALAVK